tara:strand:- start:61 stop:270 length:210 start_codon:yes stop_codon:yes gene_type:complete
MAVGFNSTKNAFKEAVMWGYTLIGFDGGEIFTSDAEFESKGEANKHAINALTDEPYAGSCEVWEDDDES